MRCWKTIDETFVLEEYLLHITGYMLMPNDFVSIGYVQISWIISVCDDDVRRANHPASARVKTANTVSDASHNEKQVSRLPRVASRPSSDGELRE